MTEITASNFREIKFTRDTKVDYANGNQFINCVFKEYDTDNSGDFNDAEWAAYEADIQKREEIKKEMAELKSKNKVVNHYTERLLRINSELEALEEVYKKIDFSSWEKLKAFEEKYPEEIIQFYKNKDDIPAGAREIDVSARRIGIYDEEKGCFTGECETTGYLVGLEPGSPEEAEYLDLLKTYSEAVKQFQKLESKRIKLEKDYDKAHAFTDLAETGYLTDIVSEEEESGVYESYVQIRDESNPFYKEIKQLEAESTKIRLAGGLTEDEKTAQIQQLQIRIDQLNEASRIWSIKDANKKPELSNSQGISIRDCSETATYSHSGSSDTLTDIHSITAAWNLRNFGLTGSLTKSEKYGLNDGSFENLWNSSLNASYRYRGLSLSSNSMVDYDKSHTMFNQTVGADYKLNKVNFGLSEGINYMYMPNNGKPQETTTLSTTVSTSLTTGKVTTTGQAVISPRNGDEYSIASRGDFGIKNLTLSPSLETSYNSHAKTYKIAPTFGTSYNMRSGKFSLGVNANESWSTTMKHGSKPQLNHCLTASGNVGYRNVSMNLKFNDMDDSSQHSNIYGAGLEWRTPKAGTFGVDYSYQRNNGKGEGGRLSETSMVSFRYSLPLDWTKRKKN